MWQLLPEGIRQHIIYLVFNLVYVFVDKQLLRLAVGFEILLCDCVDNFSEQFLKFIVGGLPFVKVKLQWLSFLFY